MNEDELKQIEARIDPFYAGEMNGKWVEDTDENGDEWIRIPGGHDVKFWNIEGSSKCCYDVIHFIAHARQDVPALCEEVRRLTNLVEALAIIIEDATGMLSDAPLSPAKLEVILGTLIGQREYATESSALIEKENIRLRAALDKLSNRFSYNIEYQGDKQDGSDAYITWDCSDDEETTPWELAENALKGGEG